MADLAQMRAQLKELRRKANDPKYPEDLRQQFDQQANDLEVEILRATKGSGMDKKDPEFKKGGKVPKGMHRMPDGRMMKDSEHKNPKKKMGGGMMKYAHGGKIDGCAVRGKTRGKTV